MPVGPVTAIELINAVYAIARRADRRRCAPDSGDR